MSVQRAKLLKTTLLTSAALCAFAANSVLCRRALGEETIDAGSFTIIRLLSGVLVLFILQRVRSSSAEPIKGGSWRAATMLFLYAITFSYAYLTLDTGTGALILFGAVQITMILASVITGTRLHWIEWSGVTLAFAGFAYLVAPGITTPTATGFLLMSTAGIAWGLYTLLGRGSQSPLTDTAHNFFRTIPFLVIAACFVLWNAHVSSEGVLLAVLSGGLASGIGYAIWYAALPALSPTQAGVLQLLVPVIAALGGILVNAEDLSSRLLIAAAMILGGILAVLLGRTYLERRPESSQQ